MTWLGAGATDRHPMYNPQGLDKGASRAKVPCRRLARGSLLLEIAIPDQFNQPLDLIDFERHDVFRRSLHMVMGPNGRLWAAVEAGQTLSVLSLDLAAWPKDSLIRITYGWDLVAGSTWLGAENLDTGALKSVTGEEPAPLYEEDLARVLFAVDGPSLTPEVQCFAFADHVEPLGYSEGIEAGALVETAFGPQRIENLTPRTPIMTASGHMSPLVACVTSHLPAIGSLAPIRLHRPFQNLRQTLDVSQRCEILTDGIDTAYLFGVEHVAMKALHIAPFLPIPRERTGLLVKRHTLILSEAEPYRVGGICILPANLCHAPETHALSRVAHLDRNAIPHRDESIPKALMRHEAVALLSPRYL